MKKLLTIFALTIILVGCKNRLEEKRNDGFQIFEDFGIAIKTPCELQLDSSVIGRKDIGNGQIYVCPQIFSDSTRTGFRFDRLLESKGTIYHLKVWPNDQYIEIEESLENLRQSIKEFEIDSCESILVDNRKGLIYGPIQHYSYEAMIPVEWCTIYVGVTGEINELKKILSEMIIEE
jgi:hypothetical protein